MCFFVFSIEISQTTSPITVLVPLDFLRIGVHQVFGPMGQKLLNINFIIEKSNKQTTMLVPW
jgi:hypothetical protein